MKAQDLLHEWIKKKYPMMAEDHDFAELDYYDMALFADWIVEKITKSKYCSSCKLDELITDNYCNCCGAKQI